VPRLSPPPACLTLPACLSASPPASADTISDLGFGHELANYGEYSGAPSEEQTYEYAKTILKLMGAERLPEAAAPAAGAAGFSAHTLKGKVLIIGGGIANFTDVAKTFAGIIRALREAAPMLIEHHVSVWVRRGGPNYQEGLRLMAEVGDEIGVPIHVYGPDTHITAIVPMALGVADTHGLKVAGETHASGTAHSAVVGPHAAGQAARPRIGSGGAAAGGVPGSTPGDIGGIDGPYSGKFGLSRGTSTAASGTDLPALATAAAAVGAGATDSPSAAAVAAARVGAGTPLAKASPSAGAGGPTSSVTTATATATAAAASGPGSLFHPGTRCIVYGMQTRAVQGMLDFDFLCKRAQPSVAAMVFPFSGNHYQKFYFGTSEMMLPVYSSTDEAVRRHPEVSVFVNFASFRSVYPSTLEALAHPGISTVAIIAEGVPEQQTRLLIKAAEAKGVLLVGPATVGGIAAGSFRIGNTGGQLDNIISCRLYRPGSVGYVSKSGGMSNELNNIMGAYTDGACEGVAIGGDRYPGSRFLDHLLRYEANPRIKMMVLLGEVGGIDEYAVAGE
jgi:ATP citrate (pro-S)-lyase